MNTKSERFEMRFDHDTLSRIEDWRDNQPDSPSRAETIRRLIDAGLSASSTKQVKFTSADKLITLMLCELFKSQKIDSDINPDFVSDVINGGHYWALDWEYPGVSQGYEDKQKTLPEVLNILDMWVFLESSFEQLSKTDKDKLLENLPEYLAPVKFSGFDGNNESEHMAIASFLIEKMGRYTCFAKRDLNSHSPSIDTYMCQLEVFEPIRKTLFGKMLSAVEIEKILRAEEMDQ